VNPMGRRGLPWLLVLALLGLLVCTCSQWQHDPDDDTAAQDDDDVAADDDDADDDSAAGDDDSATDDDDSTTNADADGDGYWIAAGDCDDNDPNVNPGADEVCDGIDNDCDGDIDVDPVDCVVANGTAACVDLQCGIAECDEGWYDMDNQYATGCEVAEDGWEFYGGDSCGDALDSWAPFTDDPPTTEFITGNLVYDHFHPDEDEDWYLIHATDVTENDGDCDPFDVDVYFSSEPTGDVRLEIYDTDCNLWSGPGEPCDIDLTVFSWDASGECPCSWTDPGEGHNTCTDNSMDFVIRVYRGVGLPSDQDYEIEIGNG